MNNEVVKNALSHVWDAGTTWRMKVADTTHDVTEEAIPKQKYIDRRKIATIVRWLAIAFLFFGYYFFKNTRYVVWIITIISFIASYFEKN
jgi:hypothetical protein